MILRRFLGILFMTTALFGGTAGFSIQPVQAQVTEGLQEVGQTVKLPATDPRVIAVNIINIALGVIGIVLLVLIIYAGFLWMTSGGDAEKVGKAKKTLTNAVIGLVIVLSSWAITKFVIERLLEATQGGGGGVTTGGGGYGGGLGGGGGGQAFLVKSITPSGNVALRNVEVKIVFNKSVDEASAGAILVSKVGGTTVGGTTLVKGSVVKFTPAQNCPEPNQDRKCFDGDSDFTVKVGSSVKSLQGQLISCSGFGSICEGAFHTGNLVDTKGPTVDLTYPLNGQSVSMDFLQDLQAEASDDSGIGMVEFFEGSNSVFVDAPTASPSPKNYSAHGSWDTAGAVIGSHSLTARAYDLDTNTAQSGSVTVMVRPAHCFNGVQDEPAETGVDCGGDPGSSEYCGTCPGGTCSSGSDCASGFCQDGKCIERPVIQTVGPLNGKPGTFVTLKGMNFGYSQGTVKFLGGAGADDDVVALPPEVCLSAGVETWSNTQVIVAVPAVGAKSGPIEITNKTSGLSDATSDGVGPSVPDFLIDDTTHPGLCALNPASETVGKEIDAVGSGFGGAADKVKFGGTEIGGPFPLWSETKVRFKIPVMNSGPYPVLIKVGSTESNPLQFTVVDKVLGAAPSLATIDPTEGPAGTYITLSGKNFGWSVGTVKFTNTAGEAIGDVEFPPACSSAFWRDDTIVVKAPSKLTSGVSVSDGTFKVKVKRSDLKESNELEFKLDSTLPLKPGICAIQPAAGPESTPVKLIGDQFGTVKPIVTFSVNKLALVDTNANQEVKTSVPVGALTGPVKLTIGSQDSNKVNFQVRNCNEAPAEICSPATEQCCPSGACKPKDESCGAVAERAEFAWRLSTGQIPVAPYVIQECNPDFNPAPTPSPSPWLGRTGGDQAPLDAIVTIRFSKLLDDTTVNRSAFHFLKCTSQSSEPCATTEPVDYKDIALTQENENEEVVTLEPTKSLATSTVYQIKVASSVKAAGAGGGTMDVDAACGTGIGGQTYGYCFRFKTKATAEPSAVNNVNVIPSTFSMKNSGDTVKYRAQPIYAQDRCVILNCKKMNWDWYTGSKGLSDDRAQVTNDKKNGLGLCEQTGTGLKETGSVPVEINAELAGTAIKPGMAKLFVNFQPPKIEAYGPNCDQACLNGKVWIRFSSKLDEATAVNPKNIVIQKCYNENCVESELLTPLDTGLMKIELVPPYGSTGDVPRLIQISPAYKDEEGITHFMLEPGGFYRVLVKGGAEGIMGGNGVPLTGLNHTEGFFWTFRTKLGTAGMCKAERIDVVPLQKYEKSVIASQMFTATPFGSPDNCNVSGQPLVQSDSAAWITSDTDNPETSNVADLYEVNGSLIDTGGVLPAGCTQKCLATGAQAVNGKVGVCGNGTVETTDPNYCSKKMTSADCKTMPVGSKAGEECEPAKDGANKCDLNTCLWKGVVGVESGGTCGNSKVDLGAGEACDFGPTCIGGSNATSSPPVPENTLCNTEPLKQACVQAGGTCAMHAYRGCSAGCRHLGSTVGKSTCGNSDVLGDGKDCDDGNTTSNDGCSALCLHEGSEPINKIFSVCGNGVLEPGETCDGSPFPGGCDPITCLHTGKLSCTTPLDPKCCGNGVLESGEDCDDRNLVNGDGCSSSCLFEGSSAAYYQGYVLSPSFCSNGILERGEQCEVGASSKDVANDIGYISSEPDLAGVIGKVYGAGDGLIDNQQLAFIVGNALPDPDSGLMTSDIKVDLEGNQAQAKYGLQCGFMDETACKLPGTGLDDYGCCAPRPAVVDKAPLGKDVCRNAQITAKFNVPMKVDSVLGNFVVEEQLTKVEDACPTGTTEILYAKAYGPGIWNWFRKVHDRIVTWFTGKPVYAQKWCKGSVTGQLKTIDNTKTFAFTLDQALHKQTTYRVRFMGDNSTTTDPLSDNADKNLRLGVKTARGVVSEFMLGPTGDLVWEFKTGDDICLLKTVTVEDVTYVPPPAKAHPYLFVNKDNKPETRNFSAKAQTLQNGVAVTISPVAEYGWKWGPWASGDETLVKVTQKVKESHSAIDLADATSEQKSGSTVLKAFLEVTNDEVSVPSTTGSGLQGIAPVSVMVCENPWPTLEQSPFRDIDPNGTVPSSFKSTDEFAKEGSFYNFSTMYCRDAGLGGVTRDDLPALEINQVKRTELDKVNGILRQYLFTYPSEDKDTPIQYRGLQKDGIGIRIMTNPQHLSPAEWYKSKGFGTAAKSLTVDGYPAVQAGTTIYVAAANQVDPKGGLIYSNIYLISYNQDAKDVTKGIYEQMVKYLTFNINILSQSNICIEDASGVPFHDPTLNNDNPIACSADWTCFITGVKDIHCDSDKQKLIRDTKRITDFQAMARTLEGSKDAQGKYPQALAGTYLRNFSNSLWTSWATEIGQAVGKSLPIDPVNRFLTCGRCLTTNTPCRNDSDCPKSSTPNTCQGGLEVSGKGWESNTNIDPQTCWNQKDHKYLCPRIGDTIYGTSRLYQYQSMVGGTRYELGSEFEIPPTDLKSWWSPLLAKGVYQCITTSTLGNFCTGADGLGDDALCRPCPDPTTCKTCSDGSFCGTDTDCKSGTCQANTKDYPVIAGACQQFGGTYKYTEICANQVLGDSGVCGDGVLNALGGEVCEIGQDKYERCTVPKTNEEGFKRQICDQSTCKSYVDDVQHPECIPAQACGNGRIDKACGGKGGEPCLSSIDCAVGVSCKAIEVCDDGLLNNTYGHCSNKCQGLAAYCGDGQLSPGEVCDLGSKNGEYESLCSLDCQGVGPFCGDLEVNGPEQCDGSAETTKSAVCSTPTNNLKCTKDEDCGAGGQCGKTEATKSCVGFSDPVTGRETQHVRTCNSPSDPSKCDWIDWSACLPIGICGDGVKDITEECDNGQGNGNTKACTSECKKNICGDGNTYVGVEECDNGKDNGSQTCSADYDSMCLSCTESCKFQATAGGYCGDENKNGPEQCDGNDTDPPSGVCPFTGGQIKTDLCPVVAPACTSPPCGKTLEVNISCKSLGYDFSKSQATPWLFGPFGNPTGAMNDSGYAKLSECSSDLEGLSYAQKIVYQKCLGLDCTTVNGVKTLVYPSALPSIKDFWKCAALKGQEFGVSVKSSGEIVSCSPSCGFSNCIRCSDEPGQGIIQGRVRDAIYQQVVPGARVSLLYKGVKVDEAFADDNGYFKFTTLNMNPACGSYRLVVDFYQDNPCTNKEHAGYGCFSEGSPAFNAPADINEGATGGYIPYTSGSFNHGSYLDVLPTPDGQIIAEIPLQPRPQPGTAYLTLNWENQGSFRAMWQIHTILPLEYDSNGEAKLGFEVPAGGNQSKNWEGASIAPCDYTMRPAGNRECARDITWRSMGKWDITNRPYAKNICLRRLGDVSTRQWSGVSQDACPFEGPETCLAMLPDNLALGNQKWTILKCKNKVEGDEGYEICNRCGADKSHYEGDVNQCEEHVSWEDCIDITYPPVSSLVNWNAMKGWGGDIELVFAKNGDQVYDHQDLYQQKFTATVVSRDINGAVIVKHYAPPANVSEGYIWRIAKIKTLTGDIQDVNQYAGTNLDVKNTQVAENKDTDKSTALPDDQNAKPVPGIACYRHQYQCGKNFGKGYVCNNEADIPGGFSAHNEILPSSQACTEDGNCSASGYTCNDLNKQVFSHLNW